MDKTKNTQQDSLQKPGQASTGSEGNTSEAEAKTYTEEQVQKAIKKAESDALAKAGRTATALEKREAAVKAKEDAQAEKERQREAAEFAEAQQDPDKLAAYQAKQVEKNRAKSLNEREADLARREAEHEAEITAAREANKEIAMWQIAASHTTDSKEMSGLFDRLKELNIDDREQLEKVAEAIMPKKPETEEKETKVDSGVTSGGKESLEGKPARQVFADYFRDEEKKK